MLYFNSFKHSYYSLFSIFLITFFWSIVNPSINHLILLGSNFSNLFSSSWPLEDTIFKSFIIRRNPSPSQRRAFILSLFPPQNRNNAFSNGFSLKFCRYYCRKSIYGFSHIRLATGNIYSYIIRKFNFHDFTN